MGDWLEPEHAEYFLCQCSGASLPEYDQSFAPETGKHNAWAPGILADKIGLDPRRGQMLFLAAELTNDHADYDQSKAPLSIHTGTLTFNKADAKSEKKW